MPAGCGELPNEGLGARSTRAQGVGGPRPHPLGRPSLGRCGQEAGGDRGEVLAHPGLDRLWPGLSWTLNFCT